MRSRDPGRGFLLIELMVVVAVIGIIAALLFPVFARVQERARQTACLSNLKQLGVAFRMYVQDHDGTYPLSLQQGAQQWPWRYRLQPYVKSRGIFTCPSSAAAAEPYHLPVRLPDGRLIRYGASYKPNRAVVPH